jgi:hypothetical protein
MYTPTGAAPCGTSTEQGERARNRQEDLVNAAGGETVAFVCTGKRFLPILLASFVVPCLAFVLVRQ